ncbi:MAG: toll/interleukin-1 receptor domain-containing protein [Lewinellaceae bacterium]|nr:toll/interleukin-1 receptor domain-containing protein [Lewinellaceae bacterium]
MPGPLHIFISYDAADSQTAADLQRQLTLVFQPLPVVFWSKNALPSEEYRVKAAAFLEKTDLFVAVLSMNYEDAPDVRWEAATAIATQTSRAGLQIITVQAREAPAPRLFDAFKSALPAGETIETQAISRDRQLKRVAELARAMVASAPRSNHLPEAKIDLPLHIGDVRERLLAQTDRINHAPLLFILKRLIEQVQVKRVVLDTEEKFKQLRDQTRLSQISFAELEEKATPVQINLQYLIRDLQESSLVANWKQVFIRDYFHFVTSSRELSTVPPFFVPVDEIAIPATYNLDAGPQDTEASEPGGLLSPEQKRFPPQPALSQRRPGGQQFCPGVSILRPRSYKNRSTIRTTL